MIQPSVDYVDRLLREDVPYGDLTTTLLGLPEVEARMTFTTRHQLVVAGARLASAICQRVGAKVLSAVPSGRSAAAGEALLVVTGSPPALHQAWKVCANVFESAAGIATRTADLVAAAHSTNPEMEVFGTRKMTPGTRELAIEALLAGGALPHRLGLSETVLVFEQHTNFLGGTAGLAELLPQLRRRACEKVVLVETDNLADAVLLAKAGAGGVQLDKVPPSELAEIVVAVREISPQIRLIAAGGITAANAGAYAATGVDGLATSWMYAGSPADIKVSMEPIG